MKKIWPLLTLGSLFLAPAAHAHVKWFVKEDATPSEPIDVYQWGEVAVQIGLGAVVLGLLMAAFFEKTTAQFEWKGLKKIKKRETLILGIFQFLIGISLVWSAFQNQTLVPLFPGSPLINTLQAIAGGLFIMQRGTTVAALILLGVWATRLMTTHPLGALEYVHFAGIASFLILKKHSQAAWALPILRIATGTALVTLAFTEKLLNPATAVVLLEEHRLNFMQALGLESFGDRLFILSAGYAELLFGLILLTGWITRTNTLALAGFLLASNAYFFGTGKIHEGWIELTGHLPLIAIAMLLIIYGSGEKLKIHLLNNP